MPIPPGSGTRVHVLGLTVRRDPPLTVIKSTSIMVVVVLLTDIDRRLRIKTNDHFVFEPQTTVGSCKQGVSGLLRHTKQVIAPTAARRYGPPPTAVRLAADLRPSADGSAVRTSLVAGQLQAASVPIACCATQPACYSLGWDRQTDGSRHRLMLCLPLRRGHYKLSMSTSMSI